MRAILVVGLLVCFNAVLAQQAFPIHSVFIDGFETVWVPDQSFVTEIHLQSFPPNNWTFFIFGSSTVRTIYPEEHGFAVGTTPNEAWHLPFVDLHVIQNGTDLWGFGPVDASPGFFFNTWGYALDVAFLTTKQGNFDRFVPIGYPGTFYAVRPLFFGDDILGYFAGFFPNLTDPFQLHFGVVRARFNLTADTTNDPYAHWHVNNVTDVGIINARSSFTTFSAFFKPIIYHAWNITGASNPNITYTTVIDPGSLYIRNVLGNIDPTVPLTLDSAEWYPIRDGLNRSSTISSATYYYPYHNIILGIGTPGMGTGAIVFIHTFNLTNRGVLHLPANFSDPKALVIDEEAGVLYVGMNGGFAILKVWIHNMTLAGYANVPPYLARMWAGRVTPEHVYFVTNEQHTKVFRLNKLDFCAAPCSEFGYCHRGNCECNPGFQLVGDRHCEWQQIIKDREVEKKEKTGEAVLGVFFALALIAAGVGWFFVWKAKRGGYQPV